MNRNKNTVHRNHKNQQGLALLEILIAIGILGIIAAGVATLASRTFEEQNANEVNDDITDVSIALQSAYKRSKDYASLSDLEVLADANAIDRASAISPITNDYYSVAPIDKTASGTGNNDAFILTISGLSSTLCTKIVTGGLLDDARYLEVVPGDGAASIASLEDDVSFPTVLKSQSSDNGGIAEEMSDPSQMGVVCSDSMNDVIVGYY